MRWGGFILAVAALAASTTAKPREIKESRPWKSQLRLEDPKIEYLYQKLQDFEPAEGEDEHIESLTGGLANEPVKDEEMDSENEDDTPQKRLKSQVHEPAKEKEDEFHEPVKMAREENKKESELGKVLNEKEDIPQAKQEETPEKRNAPLHATPSVAAKAPAPTKKASKGAKHGGGKNSLKELVKEAEKLEKEEKKYGCPKAEEGRYNVTVYTSNKWMAGTSSRVYLDLYGHLYGRRESTGKTRLLQPGKLSHSFERGGVDTFSYKAPFVGIVKRITIEHDNSGLFADWTIVKIVVHDIKLGTQHTFPCNCLLSGYDNTKALPPREKQ